MYLMEAKGQAENSQPKGEHNGDSNEKGKAKCESQPQRADAGENGLSEAAEADYSGLSEEELMAKLQEELKRPEFKMLFRLDAHLLDDMPSNYMKRATVKDFLDVFDVVSTLIGESWESWTGRAILKYKLTAGSDGEWRTVNHAMEFKEVEVMYLRLIDHDTLVATHNDGEHEIAMIRTEIHKVIAARKAEAEAQMSEEQHLRRIWGGRLPKGPQEMKLAKQMLKDEAIAAEKTARDIKRGRAGARRDDQLRQVREAASGHLSQVNTVLNAHRKHVRLSAVASKELLENIDYSQRTAELRRNRIQAKARTWTPVLGYEETSTFQPLASFCMVKAGLTTPDEPLQIFTIKATSGVDNEMGVHWNLLNVEEELSRYTNFRDSEVFLRVIALDPPTGGEPAKLGFLSSQHVGFTEGPKPGKPLSGIPMEWIFPVPVLREWLKNEQVRLRGTRGEQQQQEPEKPKTAEPSRSSALDQLLGLAPVLDDFEEKVDELKEEKPPTPVKKNRNNKDKKKKKEKKTHMRRNLNVEKEYAVPLRLTSHSLGQESMLWVEDYRIRLAEQDWSRKLSQIIRDKDRKDEKKKAVPANYIFHFN